MSNEITGKIEKILPEQSGQGQYGAWVKRGFVVETDDKYPKKVYFTTWGDKADELNKLFVGDMVTVSFRPESREYNERWYTDLKVWKIQKVNKQKQEQPPIDEIPPFMDNDMPEEEEYLPF